MFAVYILQSEKTGRYYIGSSNNIVRRLAEHNAGRTQSLLYQRRLILVFQKKYATILEARKAEKKLKSYKSRKIIEQIVRDGEIYGPLA